VRVAFVALRSFCFELIGDVRHDTEGGAFITNVDRPDLLIGDAATPAQM
jgi:hypothetical protein